MSYLNENKRARQLIEKVGAAPNNVSSHKKKSFVIQVEHAADYPHRIVKLENLQHDILQRKLYHLMTPQNLFSGEFQVAEGYEDDFKTRVAKHGFRAQELIEVL